MSANEIKRIDAAVLKAQPAPEGVKHEVDMLSRASHLDAVFTSDGPNVGPASADRHYGFSNYANGGTIAGHVNGHTSRSDANA